MKKLIALTGSFNPVTVAHYKILSDAVEKYGADEGVFIAVDDKYLIRKSLLKNKDEKFGGPRYKMFPFENLTGVIDRMHNNEVRKLDTWMVLTVASPNAGFMVSFKRISSTASTSLKLMM